MFFLQNGGTNQQILKKLDVFKSYVERKKDYGSSPQLVAHCRNITQNKCLFHKGGRNEQITSQP